jgi:hypothetical protein
MYKINIIIITIAMIIIAIRTTITGTITTTRLTAGENMIVGDGTCTLVGITNDIMYVVDIPLVLVNVTDN